MAWVLSRLLGKNQECLRRSKTCLPIGRPLGFQGSRYLIFFSKLRKVLTSSTRALAMLLNAFATRAYRQLSDGSTCVYISSAYALPVFRCPEKQTNAPYIINPLKWLMTSFGFLRIGEQRPRKVLPTILYKKSKGCLSVLLFLKLYFDFSCDEADSMLRFCIGSVRACLFGRG